MEELVCQLDSERHHIYLKREKVEEAIKLSFLPLISIPYTQLALEFPLIPGSQVTVY
jgi:hypothetical protein